MTYEKVQSPDGTTTIEYSAAWWEGLPVKRTWTGPSDDGPLEYVHSGTTAAKAHLEISYLLLVENWRVVV